MARRVEQWEPPRVGWMSPGTCSAREVVLGLVMMLELAVIELTCFPRACATLKSFKVILE